MTDSEKQVRRLIDVLAVSEEDYKRLHADVTNAIEKAITAKYNDIVALLVRVPLDDTPNANRDVIPVRPTFDKFMEGGFKKGEINIVHGRPSKLTHHFVTYRGKIVSFPDIAIEATPTPKGGQMPVFVIQRQLPGRKFKYAYHDDDDKTVIWRDEPADASPFTQREKAEEFKNKRENRKLFGYDDRVVEVGVYKGTSCPVCLEGRADRVGTSYEFPRVVVDLQCNFCRHTWQDKFRFELQVEF